MRLINRIYNWWNDVEPIGGRYINGGLDKFGQVVRYDWDVPWELKPIPKPKISTDTFPNYLEAMQKSAHQAEKITVKFPAIAKYKWIDIDKVNLDICVHLKDGKIKKLKTYKQLKLYIGWLIAHPKAHAPVQKMS